MQDTAAPTTTPPVANPLPADAAPGFSGRIADVVKLSKSGVGDSVVLAYIKNSPGPFQPSADEIIKLRDDGISPGIISAMLERGAELRAQTVSVMPTLQPYPTAYNAPYNNYAQPVMPATPAPVVTTPPETYDDSGYYTQPSSTVVYIGGGYNYPYFNYPYYSGGFCYTYPYCYPYGCYPYYGGVGLRWGYGGYRGFRGYGGFRGGIGFRGGVGGIVPGFHDGVGGVRGASIGGFHGASIGGFRGGGGGGFHGGGGRR